MSAALPMSGSDVAKRDSLCGMMKRTGRSLRNPCQQIICSRFLVQKGTKILRAVKAQEGVLDAFGTTQTVCGHDCPATTVPCQLLECDRERQPCHRRRLLKNSSLNTALDESCARHTLHPDQFTTAD